VSDPVVALGLRLVALAGAGGLLLAGRAALGWRAERRERRALGVSAAEEGGGRPAVLLFTGTLCADCGRQKDILAELRGHLGGWELREVPAARDIRLARRFGVESVPATVVLDVAGRAVAVNYGLTDLALLTRQVESLVGRAALSSRTL